MVGLIKQAEPSNQDTDILCLRKKCTTLEKTKLTTIKGSKIQLKKSISSVQAEKFKCH